MVDKWDLLIVGLVRNGAKVLSREVGNVARAFAQQARSIQWLVVESDSTDDTVAVLNGLKGRMAGFDYVSLGTLATTMPLRTERIAYCRNAYLEEIRSRATYRTVTHVAVVDLDGVNVRLNPSAVASCLRRDDWQMCAANQDAPYYDVWALRHPEWCPNDCFEQFRFLYQLTGDKAGSWDRAVHARMITIPPDATWVSVESAFGGLAIYARDALTSGQYVGLTDRGEEVCEHVAFHGALRANGAKLFINPALINAGYTEHTSALRGPRNWLRHARAGMGLTGSRSAK